MFQSSSTCADCHAASADSRPRSSASAINAEPVKVVAVYSAPSRHGSSGIAAAAALRARSGCVTVDDPFSESRSRRRVQCAPSQGLDPSAAPGARAVAVDRRRDSTIDPTLGIFRFPRPPARQIGNAIDDRIGSRVSGIFAGSMRPCCASHSAAMAPASSAVGAASARPAGVRTGLPSRHTAKSAPAGMVRPACRSAAVRPAPPHAAPPSSGPSLDGLWSIRHRTICFIFSTS